MRSKEDIKFQKVPNGFSRRELLRGTRTDPIAIHRTKVCRRKDKKKIKIIQTSKEIKDCPEPI